jgi:hypothetical protein
MGHRQGGGAGLSRLATARPEGKQAKRDGYQHLGGDPPVLDDDAASYEAR